MKHNDASRSTGARRNSTPRPRRSHPGATALGCTSEKSQWLHDGLKLLGPSRDHATLTDLMEQAAPYLQDERGIARFARWAGEWNDKLGWILPAPAQAKARHRDARDPRGHKSLIQVVPGMSSLATRDQQAPGVIRALLEATEEHMHASCLAFREHVLHRGVPTLVSTRLIRYLPGTHAAQRWHLDGGITTLIHRPAGDDRLLVGRPGQDLRTAASNSVAAPSDPAEPSTLLITGAQCGLTDRRARALPHAVKPLETSESRFVATSFLWPAPPLLAGILAAASPEVRAA